MTHIIYLGYLDPNRSRSGVHFRYLNNLNPKEILYVKIETPFWRSIKIIRNINNLYDKNNDILVVTSPTNMIVIYIRLFTRFKIVLDAGWPLSDNTDMRNKSAFKKLKTFLIDYWSFSYSNIVLVESIEQKKLSINRFVRHQDTERIKVLRTGFNEIHCMSQIRNEKLGKIALDGVDTSKYSLVVFFRGKQNKESGLENIEVLAKNNPDILFLIASQNYYCPQSFTNVIIENKFLNWKELANYYDKADLVLGQMSDDERLQKTIAHKVYEAAYFAKPLLTSNSRALNEIFIPNREYIDSGNSSIDEIDRILKFYKKNQIQLVRIGKNMKNRYEKNCSQEMLSIKFLNTINGLSKH